MAGEEFAPLEPIALAGLRFGIAEGLPLERLDDTVASAFAAAIARLDDAGVRVTRETLPLFDDMVAVNAKGGISPPEACAVASRPAASGAPPTSIRMSACASSAAAPSRRPTTRTCCANARGSSAPWMRGLTALDVLVMPTTSIVAPTIAEVADRTVFAARNAAVLRNTNIINFFDLCAISLPLPAALPVGLMLVARNGQDRRLLRIAAAVMQLFGADLKAFGACRRRPAFPSIRQNQGRELP